MREVKTFFLEGNRLNKGHTSHTETMSDDQSIMRRRVAQNLPSADLMAVYEEMHPGTFEKLIKAFEKEQLHRHNAELASIQMHAKASAMGRLFGFFVTCAICYTTFQLAINGMEIEALIFAAIAFVSVLGVSSLSYFRSSGRYDRRRHDAPPRHHSNASVRQHNEEQKENNGQVAVHKGPRHHGTRRRRR